MDIDRQLQSWEKSLTSFGLPTPTEDDRLQVEQHYDNTPVVIKDELDFNIDEMQELVRKRQAQFTPEQEEVFSIVIGAIQQKKPLQLFLDARGGCGKTFLLNAILAAVRTLNPQGCIALATGTTGIAANLLLLGRTFHSQFKAPLTPTENQVFKITGQSVLTKLLQMAKLIIVDEATMLHKVHL